ncbi:MAG: hypothetical protein QNI87_10365 [Erythrobacter sp.]|nr:hypothetical protein [Erythrobacter sp.]MDJ0978928.1 hypothetical protein [Erythrobacter sp.]
MLERKKTWTKPSIEEFKIEELTQNGGDGPDDGSGAKDDALIS